jgi:hypothetical protein
MSGKIATAEDRDRLLKTKEETRSEILSGWESLLFEI